MVDDLDPTEDGEASEESHVAADEGDEGGEGDLHVLLHHVVGWSSDVQVDKLEWLVRFVFT